jgi:hypothetical protein
LLRDERDLPRRRRHRLEQFAAADTGLLTRAAIERVMMGPHPPMKMR